MFQHIPWFSSDPEARAKDYFEIEYATRKRMLDKLLDAGETRNFYILIT